MNDEILSLNWAVSLHTQFSFVKLFVQGIVRQQMIRPWALIVWSTKIYSTEREREREHGRCDQRFSFAIDLELELELNVAYELLWDRERVLWIMQFVCRQQQRCKIVIKLCVKCKDILVQKKKYILQTHTHVYSHKHQQICGRVIEREKTVEQSTYIMIVCMWSTLIILLMNGFG